MRILLRAVALATAVTMLLVLAACPGKKDTAAGSATATGSTAGGTNTALSGPPDFVSFDGQSIRLADYEGKPVVLNFWAVW